MQRELWDQYARASWGLTRITMITYAALISYLRRRPRRKDRPRCGAKTRVGRPCRMRVEFGKARCRLHGGLSTGPKTEAGRARIAVAQRRRWRLYRERRLGTSLAEASIVKPKDSDRGTPMVTGVVGSAN